VRRVGAPAVFLSGSGPTVVGLFTSIGEAESAAAELDRDDTIVCLA
jgi:4-diphosphocytidyl-2C-methyl-D-erythritol kinase